MTHEEKQAFYYEKIAPMMNLCFKKEASLRILIITKNIDETVGFLAAHYREVQEYLEKYGNDSKYYINFRLEIEIADRYLVVKSINPENGKTDFTYYYTIISEGNHSMKGMRQDIALIANGFWELTMLRMSVEKIAQLVIERDYRGLGGLNKL